MNKLSLTDPQIDNRHRDITRSNDYLQNIAERYDNFVSDGKMDVIGRVFHRIPCKHVSVSYNPASAGSTHAREVLHLGSYNYSGLNGHQRIIESSINATHQYGTTSSGVRLLNGTSDLHLEMEQRLAKFLDVEEVITFSSGFSANLAALSTLCREGDIVFSDILNHQSIVDGLKLSGATTRVYKHASLQSLENKLRQTSFQARKFIITDGVFSMDGDLAPLPGIVELARKYNAFVIVDDAHGTGHIGPNGRGSCAHFGITDQVDVITGSLSKGLPGIGGFIGTNKKTGNIIRVAANPYIYSASLPPAILASIISAIDILESSPQLTLELQTKAKYFRQKLRDAGFNILNSETAIVPLITGDEHCCYVMTRMLHEKGIYVNPVTYPAVSKTRARIRINLSANLNNEELDYSIRTLIQIGQQLALI
ncbi:aminotransferase class I/II-fold pyridoxal phosphate-dependent enzyme [Xenorhabdus budapestensis]|uniref:Putative acyl-CoA transferase n=1 Tax=Xenorhabdus budapestensis TaxID=290110 RepID=A0A2D0J1S5_XENBU|nr:pyridoxal phosphate-dependent aminotransferase family protein [Xenorhabdus budapestensis]PHM28275.1 putative acyl-CoA transferase [Xenorhabdus budapestensis]QTL40431.1 pyridoxal phosphate-dependent aminotransferase family protein [Xenorhabdus budapestensis]